MLVCFISGMFAIFIIGKNLGVGIFAIAIASIAIWLSLKTDELVESLAYVQFNEKIASMTINLYNYRNLDGSFKNNLIVDGNYAFKTLLHQLRWDFRAVSHLKNYVPNNSEEIIEIHNIISQGIQPVIDYYKQHPPNADQEILADIADIENTINKFNSFATTQTLRSRTNPQLGSLQQSASTQQGGVVDYNLEIVNLLRDIKEITTKSNDSANLTNFLMIIISLFLGAVAVSTLLLLWVQITANPMQLSADIQKYLGSFGGVIIAFEGFLIFLVLICIFWAIIIFSSKYLHRP